MSLDRPSKEPFPQRIRKVYTAAVTGEGRVLPIVETVGRRVLRQISPESAEGERLLRDGRVNLWADDGTRARLDAAGKSLPREITPLPQRRPARRRTPEA